LAIGCSSEPNRSERTGTTQQAIINGVESPAAQDFVVQLAYTKSGNRIAHCTGTVVAKRLILTARHCVGDVSTDDSTVTDYKPGILQVFTGTDASKRVLGDGPPNAKGAKLFVAKSTSLIPDVAVILTDADLDTPIAQLRLDAGVVKNESLDLVGYGLTEDSKYPPARKLRAGIKVFSLGPSEARFFNLAAGEYVLGEGACSGDSGGPALSSKTGAVVGIASRVGNGKDKTATPAAAFCTGDVVEDVYGDLTLAKPLLDEAFADAGDEPWIEGQADPKTKSQSSSGGSTPAASDSGCNAGRIPFGFTAIGPALATRSDAFAPRSIAFLLLVLGAALRRAQPSRDR
jgi:hypothetical protein